MVHGRYGWLGRREARPQLAPELETKVHAHQEVDLEFRAPNRKLIEASTAAHERVHAAIWARNAENISENGMPGAASKLAWRGLVAAAEPRSVNAATRGRRHS